MFRKITAFLLVSIFAIVLQVSAAEKTLTTPDEEVAVLDTSMGKITIEFYSKAAPKHVENFKTLAKKGFYNGSAFHRVIPGFMIQGGDPNSKDNDRGNDGTGDAGYKISAEFNPIPHKRGIVSMARAQDPDSASCQFFIMVADYPSLDGKYSVFGNVVTGMDVADKIVNAKRDARDNPLQPIKVKTVTIQKRAAK